MMQRTTGDSAAQVLAIPDLGDPVGLRDRAVMEVLYSAGIRRSELCRLRLIDVDAARGTIMIERGKGGRDRVIPIGERRSCGSTGISPMPAPAWPQTRTWGSCS